jgi:molybdopterin-containing oxidoreductase family membrane subunit
VFVALFRFVRASLGAVLRGSREYYLWVLFLLAWIALGLFAYVHELQGDSSGMSDQVPWGAYIANYTYLVGIAAAAVTLVIPAYIYHDHAIHEVVLLGELLAIVAITMCLTFVMADIGHPDRFWHMMPPIGRLNWPVSALAWNVIVLNGYLFLNLYIASYLLFAKFRGKAPARMMYLPVVFLAIPWAIGIHTSTAFLYAGLAGRPFWNSAILPPRFIVSAFVGGPSLMIIALSEVRDRMGFPVRDAALNRMRQLVAVTILINIYFIFAEVVTDLYSNKDYGASMRYLLFGLHGRHKLVPYIWSAFLLEIFAAAVFTTGRFYRNPKVLRAACMAAIVGVWVEKGMGLLIPGFVPSPLGEIVEYSPSFSEFCVSAAVWALGALMFTLLLKVAVPIEMGTLRMKGAEASK